MIMRCCAVASGAQRSDADPEAAASPLVALTDRELEVFEMLGAGLGTRAISERLSLSVKTVEAHCANMKPKLGVANQAELTNYAMRWYAEQG